MQMNVPELDNLSIRRALRLVGGGGEGVAGFSVDALGFRLWGLAFRALSLEISDLCGSFKFCCRGRRMQLAIAPLDTDFVEPPC